MTTTNHIAAGSVIALSMSTPWLTIPLAFASHFLLDAVPHFGYGNQHGWAIVFKHKLGRIVTLLDIIGIIFLVFFLLPQHTYIFLVGLVALSPDFLWPLRYYFYERHGRHAPNTAFTDFHNRIQRYERPWGLIVELGFFGLMAWILVHFLN